MAESTGERPASLAHSKIIDEAKRLEESTLYSMKGHHCAAARWRKGHLWLGLPSVVISGLVGATAFTKLAEQQPWIGYLAGALAIFVAILSGVTTFLNPNDREAAHLSVAHGYDKLNNDARFFHSIVCWQGESEEFLTARLRTLIDEKDKLNANSPQIPDWAYKKARKGIDAGETKFEVDKEEPPPPTPSKPHGAPDVLPPRSPPAPRGPFRSGIRLKPTNKS
ncbi:SLATT domain-containing protein [Bradyrhizobium australiense]|uniref:SLATT domain-containing protein n=1 Tax=Bradyrhizobium australiense TaxID=2721161 RepID=A0A7Y4GS94_9BRAD|nr:SLATT domain-containing protein [Bradyrhizobium australiense]NOJ40896.1 SLATT domain-containing protein [Bradyrhizobium australiense]